MFDMQAIDPRDIKALSAAELGALFPLVQPLEARSLVQRALDNVARELARPV